MTVTRTLLLVVAWIILGAATLAALVSFALALHTGMPPALALVLPLSILGGALVVALIYLGLAVIIRGQLLQLNLARAMARNIDQNLMITGNLERQLLHVRSTVDDLAGTPADHTLLPAANDNPDPAARQAITTPLAPSDATSQILTILTQLRDVALLTESQRLQWAAGILEKRKAAMAAQVQAELDAGQWTSAASLIKKIRESLPGDPLADTLDEALRTQKAQQLQMDLDEAQNNLPHLMAINAWNQVQLITENLESRYPDEPAVHDLVRRVRHEQETWHRDGLAMLLADYRDAVDHRQWVRACSLAQQVLQRYPEDKLAEKIRGDLTTLRQNAEIQTRHELESQYADLIKRQRHEEAVAIAQRVLEVYPDSATAREMQKHLPRLLDIIKQEKTRKQHGHV
jgi:outer membrane protein assembly factor BamD (BamD/ComL family)